jgi:hypothetical protein
MIFAAMSLYAPPATVFPVIFSAMTFASYSLLPLQYPCPPSVKVTQYPFIFLLFS